ncbi:MAG: DHH family phosphoesterase [Candidatus Woesearchaeota archaeon]|nr:DHH family phosphoesterase [Candidatus Woesearchaeota archaeon]
MNSFFSSISTVADKLKKVNMPIRVVSHLDADGICSAAIMLKALNRMDKKYHLSIVKQLSEDVLIGLGKESYEQFIFTDLGCGQLEHIEKYISKDAIILDHHSFEQRETRFDVINPHMHGYDGSKDISGAGVTYLFSKALDEKNIDSAYLAIIGAIGDVQESEGFKELNSQILDDAIKNSDIMIEKNLRWFGLETKPLMKLLCFGDIKIPGIENESSALEFLNSLEIEAKNGDNWRLFRDLDEEEKSKLISGIIMRRSSLEKPEDIFRQRYMLPKESIDHMKDVREYSTLLNACGRMDKATIGVMACMGKNKEDAVKVLEEYRKELVEGLKWLEGSKEYHERFIILNAKDKVRPTIIGTLASILSNNNEIMDGTIILSLAYDGDKIKASLRIKGNHEIDLRDIIKDILEKVPGEGGGHKNAAGAILDKADEMKFIDAAKEKILSINVR